MASCGVLALFTTPIHSSIKNSTSTFDGSYERCGQSDQLRSFEGKNHWLFQLLAKEMEPQPVGLLFYTKVPWLSRDKRLSWLHKLNNEVEVFLRENKNNLHVRFYNEEFVVMLAYLADIFGHFSDMNSSLQGRDVTVSDLKDKLAGLTARIGVWQARIKVHYFVFFVGKAPENE